METKKVRVAVVGLGFGAAFPPIYSDHPDVDYVGICDTNRELLDNIGDRHGITRRHVDADEILSSDDYNAVQLVTPIATHAAMSLEVLKSGKHCACAVPTGTSLEELTSIVDAERETGLVYMMMETSVYSHHYLHAKELHARGDFGKIQFLRGAYYQDMVGWPDSWLGFPPMHYSTHAIAPLLAIASARAINVHCFGSGTMASDLIKRYGNPFPLETAIFQLDTEQPLAMEVTRSLFETARGQMESFNIYGSKRTLEWHMENEPPVVFHMSDALRKSGHGHAVSHERVIPPDTSAILPPEIQKHTWQRVVPDPNDPLRSVLGGSAHYGSHPHLVHEFVRSVAEGRRSAIDSVTAADWTAPGICAHASAMDGGREVAIPEF